MILESATSERTAALLVDAGEAAGPEAALMGRYCDGDARAFHQLYALCAPKILGYLTTLVRERAAAEDLLQLTFLKVHQARHQYVRDANPVPWIYTIAHRTFLDELRRKKAARLQLTSDGQLAHEPRATLSGDAEGAGDGDGGKDGGISVADLDCLPANQKEALILTKVHGRSVSEAAMITGSSPGAIKQRAHRAYVTLRERFARRQARVEDLA